MTFPIHTTLRGTDHSPAFEASVRRHAEKLSTFCSRITSCRVVCDVTQKNGRHDCDVMVRVRVPGDDIVVHHRCRDDEEGNAYHCLNQAFAHAERAVKKYSLTRQGRQRRHDALLSPPPTEAV